MGSKKKSIIEINHKAFTAGFEYLGGVDLTWQSSKSPSSWATSREPLPG